MRGAHGKRAKRTDSALAKKIHHSGETLFVIHGGNHNRLLMLLNPPRYGFLFLKVARWLRRGIAALAQVPVHFVHGLVILCHGIELHNMTQFAYENLKQIARMLMRTNRLREPDQRLVTRRRQLPSFKRPNGDCRPVNLPFRSGETFQHSGVMKLTARRIQKNRHLAVLPLADFRASSKASRCQRLMPS